MELEEGTLGWTLASPAVLNLSAPCCPLVVTAASMNAEQGRPGCPGVGMISEPGGVAEGTRFVFSPTLGPQDLRNQSPAPDRASAEVPSVQPCPCCG